MASRDQNNRDKGQEWVVSILEIVQSLRASLVPNWHECQIARHLPPELKLVKFGKIWSSRSYTTCLGDSGAIW